MRRTDNCTAAQDRSLNEADAHRDAVPLLGEFLDIVEELDGKLTAAKERIAELEAANQ